MKKILFRFFKILDGSSTLQICYKKQSHIMLRPSLIMTKELIKNVTSRVPTKIVNINNISWFFYFHLSIQVLKHPFAYTDGNYIYNRRLSSPLHIFLFISLNSKEEGYIENYIKIMNVINYMQNSVLIT